MNARTAGAVLAVLVIVNAMEYAGAIDYTWSRTGSGTYYGWNDVNSWGGSGYPNATSDKAILYTAASDLNVDLNATITLGAISSNTGSLRIRPGSPAGSFIFDNGTGGIQTITWTAQQRYGIFVTANMLLNDNLTVDGQSGARNYEFTGIISGDGKLTVNSPNLGGSYYVRIGGSSANTYTGGTRFVGVGGVRAFGANGVNAFGTGAVSLNRANLNLYGYSQTIAGLDDGANSSILRTSAGTPTLTLAGAGTYAYAGNIQDAIALLKSGSGTQTLSGTNTHTGGTSINDGRLDINGSNAGLITVNDGGELGGYGTIGGLVTVKSGATHSPGTSPGVQTFSGGLTYESGAALQWELASNTDAALDRGIATGFDGVNVTGGNLGIDTGAQLNLVFNVSGSSVNWTDTFWNEGRTWLMIDYTGTGTSSGNFGTVNVSLDSAGQSLAGIRSGASFTSTREGDNIYVSYIIPEPATAGMFLLGIVGMAFRRRQKIQQA